MQNHSNIDIFFENLLSHSDLDKNKVGSFRLLNKCFTNPDNLSTKGYDFLNIFSCDEITLSGREKNFVIPKNVKTFSVHMITSGKAMLPLHFNHIYFNHYMFLNKEERGREITDFQDNTILKHCNFILYQKSL